MINDSGGTPKSDARDVTARYVTNWTEADGQLKINTQFEDL